MQDTPQDENQPEVSSESEDMPPLQDNKVQVPNSPESEKLSESALINGLPYEEYKLECQQGKIIKGSWPQCSFCTKFFSKKDKGFLTTNNENEPICYHCLFWVNHDVQLRST